MLNSTFEIQPFTPKYAKAVAALEAMCFSEPWSADGVLESFNTGTLFLVAVTGENIIGYGGVQMVADEGYITNIAVDPAHRRQGVGDALTKALVKAAQQAGLAFISLEVRAGNLAAQRLYQNNGFTPQGRRKNFYRLPTEDALILTNFLKDGSI